VDLYDFDENALRDPEVLEFAKRVTVTPSPDFPRDDATPHLVEIELRSGERITRRNEKPIWGSPARKLSWEDTCEKVRHCHEWGKPDQSREQLEEFIKRMERLEELESVSELLAPLR
jgi:2-methylcitrate dehydratase PrpD